MKTKETISGYVRIIYKTPEFEAFYEQQPPKTQLKFDYVINVIATIYNVQTKLAKLTTANSTLDNKYGASGSPERDRFDSESVAWFYGNMLRERRKELNLTQKELAAKLGREQSYIARVENGKSDIQLSSFLRIAAVLGIQFIPTFVQ